MLSRGFFGRSLNKMDNNGPRGVVDILRQMKY